MGVGYLRALKHYMAASQLNCMSHFVLMFLVVLDAWNNSHLEGRLCQTNTEVRGEKETERNSCQREVVAQPCQAHAGPACG